MNNSTIKSILTLVFSVLLITSFNFNSFGLEPTNELEFIMDKCGSLEKYQKYDSLCTRNGFTYPKIEVNYITPQGNDVVMVIKQAVMGPQLWDSKVQRVYIECSYCKSSNFDEAPIDATNGLTLTAKRGVIKTRPAGSGGLFNTDDIKDVFKGITTNIDPDWSKNLLEGRRDAKASDMPYIVVAGPDGNPIGGGYLKDGMARMNVQLQKVTEDGHTHLEWEANLPFDEGMSVIDVWRNLSGNSFGSGGTSECKVKYYGDGKKMNIIVTCSI